jgi:hypothetical protein
LINTETKQKEVQWSAGASSFQALEEKEGDNPAAQ